MVRAVRCNALWSGDWFVRVNVYGDGIAAMCCSLVGGHLIRPAPRAGVREDSSDDEGDTALTGA